MHQPDLTVYHDGSCPLCRLEIDHYRRQDGADHIAFIDVSDLRSGPGPDLSRSAAMSRFHVRMPDGELRDGAQAFVAVWEQLPRWRWVARLARMPGVLCCLELGYTAFLPLRPLLARIAGLLNRR